ncbi:Pls/PosA family non-ribosomal peptide synthetase [Pseudonocardia xinjiangensis]|uniref:Pls/PosA family non-ribosomal peptide synthetase n=1 Tax=Pseudonocardia xinjiangensis TaxID=75289 RepID=UPI003D8B9236
MTTLQEPAHLPPSHQDGPAVLVASDHAQGSRARRGERLDHVFEERCDWMRTYGRAGHLAVDAGETTLTFTELDERANRLARYLLANGARPGDRIGLLFDQAVHSYIGMLAVLKINAAYVPLDVAFPPDRIAYILSDAGVRMVLSLSHVRDRVENLEDFAPGLVYLDEAAGDIARLHPARLSDAERGDAVEDLAYLIYTSGTTGRPKGVAIEHASICNFVRVAAEVYGITAQDRVYQGMTIAFDFSVEEIWVPWVAGATLVPKPAGSSLLGLDLHEFLTERRVTAMCVVPTLLATLEEDLPLLRFLLVSGEACPQDLIARWHKPGRRFLNVYGPTEATVTATWTTLHPDRPVTIGQPLPTYTTVILDPDNPHRALPHGETGEIGIAGIGLATGYLNRDDLTAKAFIPDFLDIAGNPSGRIYRTGDLGRVNAEREIEYMGRIDLQVKIRGYRIELTEIESVLLQVPGIAAAVVDTFEPAPGTVELVGYYSLRTGVTALDAETITAHLRERLPSYMVPAYLEHLPVIPMTPQDKVDRRALPAPTAGRAGASAGEHVAAATDTEQVLVDALAATLGVEQVSVDSHFFDDLGANSLLMAQFSARVRKQTALPSLSMREIYQCPTVRQLAAAFGGSAPLQPAAPVEPVDVPRFGRPRLVAVGAAQLLLFLASAYLTAVVVEQGFSWVTAGAGWLETYTRAVVFGGATFLGFSLLPIVAKWLLIGRWTAQEFPVWSLRHLRFWFVRTLIRANPMVLFAGSPLYLLYLRALGAKIGRGVVVFSRSVPVCTDLLTIGDGTVIRKDSTWSGYRAVAGRIETGPVTLGAGVLVGEQTVLDIGTSIGDGGRLGHASSLQTGQHVPAGERWHGSPAEPAGTAHASVPPARCAAVRRFVYSAWQLVNLLLLVPLGFTIGSVAVQKMMEWDAVPTGTGSFWLTHAALSAAAFFGLILGGLLFVTTVPRVLSLALRADTVYPLYGLRYGILRTITRTTNAAYFMNLFGDSSYIIGFLRALGYRMRDVQQTGSNFGVAQKHDTPYLVTIGSGTLVSDGISIINADVSSTSFRLSEASLGSRSFLGNAIAYPAGARIGDNVLIGTKAMVPIDGPIRSDVGLLGSPSFEIPRSVDRDSRFDHLKSGDEFRRRLAAKNRHNLATIAIFLVVGWFQFFATTLIGRAAVDLFPRFGELVIVGSLVATLLFSLVYTALVEHAATGFRKLQPRFCSIYEPYFWWHERVWKLMGSLVAIFNGTPFKPVMWKLMGVRIGRGVFDDGCAMPEKSLVTVGDGVTLNAGSVIQCHSLEDGTFKSDHTVIGAGATVGVGAFVHYGVTMGPGSVLDADAFLMKGTETAPHSHWQGNPATEGRAVNSAPAPAPAPASASAPASAPVPVAEPVPAVASVPATPIAVAAPARAAGPVVTRLYSLPSPPAPTARPLPAPVRAPLTAQENAMPATPTSRLSVVAPAEQAAGGFAARPRVTTALPGPRSSELLARQEQRESNARVYPRHFPFAVAEAAGSHIRDLDGNVFIDFLSGAGVLSLGHNHPELVAAATEQMGIFTHGLDMPSPAKDAFTEAQLSMLPAGMRVRMKIQFCGPTGANAVDAALKLCKTATGRGGVVSFQGGFHGSSHAAMAMTGNVSQKRPITNGMPGVSFFPFSSCSRCPLALDPETCQTNCVSFLERALRDPNGGLELPAAVIMEMVQGEGGVIPARKEFVQRVRQLTRELGIPLIVDEVQTGCGRTGTWFAFEQYDIEPDVIVASKALSGMGLPVAIVLYAEELDTWAPGAHSGTFRGNQLAFAAGTRTVEIVRRDDILGNVQARGEQIAARLSGLASHPGVLEVRGKGLMWGIELTAPGDGRTVAELAEDVQARALRSGLIVELGGRDHCVVRMLPPLNVTAEVVDIALSILLHAIEGAYVDATRAA